MAPDEPNQKRKRGRPPAASKVAEGASGNNPHKESVGEPAGGERIAEDVATQRKRGRPRKSMDSVAQDDSRHAPAETSLAGTPSSAAPKKRGRPPKSRGPDHEEADPADSPPHKRRRADGASEPREGQGDGELRKSSRTGKPPATAQTETTAPEAQDTAERESRRSRRDRQQDDRPAAPSAKEPEAVHGQPDKSKGKPGRKPKKQGQPTEEAEAAEDSNSARRSRRERRSADDNPGWAAQRATSEHANARKEEQAAPPQTHKRGRPSLAELSVSKAQNQAGPPQSDKQVQRKRGGRPSVASTEGDTSNETAESSSHPTTTHNRPPKKPSARPRPSPTAERPPVQTSPQPRTTTLTHYRHLATRTRQIPRATIASKWTPLATPSITAVDTILADAARPVLHRLRDRDARRAQAQAILRLFAARLRGKLVKGMPFPPATTTTGAASGSGGSGSAAAKGRGRGRRGGEGGKGDGGREAELDFEKTVDAIAGLEKVLDPLLHGVALLKAEREREERALKRDYALLRRLEANARAQARGWRERSGREHVLAAGVGGGDGEGMGRELEVVGKGVAGEGGGSVFKDLHEEEELLALSQQIGSHMESMRSNLAQIEGVLPAIAKSKAALQGVLCEHLDLDQYAHVLLG